MLDWHIRTKKSIAAFFVKWNDIDVYVEDTAKFAKTLYISLLRRMLKDGSQISNIYPLGDRKRVVDAALADIAHGGRRRIYLIDPDLDLIAGLPVPQAPRLFVHRVYHVENYLLCEAALCEILHEENPRFSSAEIAARLDFGGWLNYASPLLKLFETFALTRHLDPSLKTIGLGVGQFQTNHQLDHNKIAAFCATRQADLTSRHSAQAVATAQAAVANTISAVDRYQDLISARDFLFPTLKWWVAARGLQWPSGKEGVLVRLAKLCSLSRHAEMVTSIAACATSK